MKTNKLAILITFLISIQSAFAQQQSGKTKVQQIKIGEIIPDLQFSNLLNYKQTHAKLSDMKGKVVILDFWDTGCGPCIAAFPHLDSLVQEFKDQLVIIPVTREKNDAIRNFIDRSLSVRKIKLSMPFENHNTEFKSYFPHLSVPHQVWISRDGKYLGATQEIDHKKLHGVLEGKIKNMGETNTTIVPFNYSIPFEILSLAKPLFYKKNEVAFDTMYSEAMTESIKGVSVALGLPGASPRIFATNTDITNLYALAFGILTPKRRALQRKRIIIESKDRERLVEPRNRKLFNEWIKENWYSYDLTLNDFPLKYAKDFPKDKRLKNDTVLSNILLETLRSKFHYKAKIERREVECLIYKITDSTLLKTDGGQSKFGVYPGYTGATIRNTRLSEAIENLGHALNNYITLNETNYDGPVDIELNVPLDDVNALSQEYAKYGIALTFEKRFIDMIVIYDE